MRRSARGFTLLEAIVVLVITSLVAVVVVQGFGLILAARTSVQTKILDLDRVVRERNLFLEPLRGLLPDYPERPHTFRGAARELHGLTVHPLQGPLGAPVGFTLTMEYDSGADRTALIYKEDGMAALTLGTWEGNFGAFSYRDRVGEWLPAWPPKEDTTPPQAPQTPWLIRIQMGTGFPSSLIASVNGSHRRIMRLQDLPIGNF